MLPELQEERGSLLQETRSGTGTTHMTCENRKKTLIKEHNYRRSVDLEPDRLSASVSSSDKWG